MKNQPCPLSRLLSTWGAFEHSMKGNGHCNPQQTRFESALTLQSKQMKGYELLAHLPRHGVLAVWNLGGPLFPVWVNQAFKKR